MADPALIKSLKDQYDSLYKQWSDLNNEYTYIDTLLNTLDNQFFSLIRNLNFDFPAIQSWRGCMLAVTPCDNVDDLYPKWIPLSEYDEPKRKAFIQAFQKIVWDFQGKINELKLGTGKVGNQTTSHLGNVLQSLLDCYTGKQTVQVRAHISDFVKAVDPNSLPKIVWNYLTVTYNGFSYVAMNPIFYPIYNNHTPDTVLDAFKGAYSNVNGLDTGIKSLNDYIARHHQISPDNVDSPTAILYQKVGGLETSIGQAGGTIDTTTPPNLGDEVPPPDTTSTMNITSQNTSTGLSGLQISMIIIGGLFLLIGGGIILTRSK